MDEKQSRLNRQDGCVLLAGPTASGKSAIALAIAEEFDGVIINADSMQIYDGLHIITARPSAEDEARVPHKLYGVLAPEDYCTAARWRDMALDEIEAARAGGRLPVVVGGTGLYFDILTRGIADIPEIPDKLRRSLRTLQQEKGTEAIYTRLEKKDPAVAARLNTGDTQRLLRALEVIEATGISLDEWHRREGTGPVLEGPRIWLALTPDRDWIYDRCNRRLDWMVGEGGALTEVNDLMRRDLDPSLPAMKALGVPELIRYLDGKMEKEVAVTRVKMLTRRYAKRQMTWIRNKMCEANCSFAQDMESLREEFFPIIRRFLLTLVK